MRHEARDRLYKLQIAVFLLQADDIPDLAEKLWLPGSKFGEQKEKLISSMYKWNKDESSRDLDIMNAINEHLRMTGESTTLLAYTKNQFFFALPVDEQNRLKNEARAPLADWIPRGPNPAEAPSPSANEAVNQNERRVPVAPDYAGIDPMKIDISVDLRSAGTHLPAHLLYHAPIAAHLWEAVKEADPYKPLYRQCEDGLRMILKQDGWEKHSPKPRLVFNLGAGSASKDRVIHDVLSKLNSNEPAYCWVDASWAMIHRTIIEFNRRPSRIKHCGALLVDFEQPGKLRSIYEQYFRSPFPKFEEPKAFFILGFTLSNLDEARFFVEYAKYCSKGDVFVFPMQFIPEENRGNTEKLKTFREGLLKNYDFPEGRELSTAGLVHLQRYKFKDFGDAVVKEIAFDGKFESLSVEFSVELEDKEHKQSATVVTARSSRHYEKNFCDFLTTKKFEVLDRAHVSGGVTTMLVRYVGPDKS